MNVNVSIGPGEVCTYDVRAKCGVPSFFPDGQNIWDLKILSIDYDDGDVATDIITQPGTNKEFYIPKNSEIISYQSNNLGLKYLGAALDWTFDSGILADGTAYHTV